MTRKNPKSLFTLWKLERPLDTFRRAALAAGVRVSGTIRCSGKITLPNDAVLTVCPECGAYVLLTEAEEPGPLRLHRYDCWCTPSPADSLLPGKKAFSYGKLCVDGDDVSVVGAVCPETREL